ncbi:MAG: enoyl-CoA hydratase-related protein, partial [Pseudomonadota bacterium]
MSLEIETDGRGVRTLWLNRPEKHNAMDAALMDALTAAAGDVRVGEVRVLVLAARGPTFCAGGDLKWMRAQFQAAPAERRAEAER